MSFGKRLSEARKKKGLSQEELAKAISSHGPVIGRYERDIAKPTVEVAGKLARVLDVSVDYLVGFTDIYLDAETKSRIREMQQLPEEEQEKVFYFIDMAIRDFKARKAYSK